MKQTSLRSITEYYFLTKPGIIYGNVLTTIAGFFLGAMGHIHLLPFLGVLVGTGCIIGSACVFNNYIDRDIDKKMERTKKRALATGTIPVKSAMIFGILLGVVGVGTLLWLVNILTVCMGIIGFIDYVFLYGIAKRRAPYGTLVGSISGSMPIVAGYTAATNHFDIAALLLFLILTFWQMPHFYAIAIYRLRDYTSAGIPVLPAIKGVSATKIAIVAYTIVFFLAVILLSILGYAGYFYLGSMGIFALAWLWKGFKGLFKDTDVSWAKGMFFFSLIIILVLSLSLPLDSVIRHGILIVW